MERSERLHAGKLELNKRNELVNETRTTYKLPAFSIRFGDLLSKKNCDEGGVQISFSTKQFSSLTHHLSFLYI